ncbi:MAG: EthD domain-containing protein [Proteobacteria bacterium]|nr:EthD domain-containing protein [Pseudomonadota bacterium]
MAQTPRPAATDGAKIVYLIKRRADTAREELVMHWFANHMPDVIHTQLRNFEKGRRHATKYIATLFDADDNGAHPWDGMAQLWWDAPLNRPAVAHGTEPTDTFQQKAEPYLPWATTEYVILDGQLPVEPLTLNDPYPTTRSGFFKVTFLLTNKPGVEPAALFDHWLEVHVPNVRGVMEQVGGFRYVVSLSLEPHLEPYAGMAELYYHTESDWIDYRKLITDDGMGELVDADATLRLHSHVQMIGIP